MTAPLPHEMVQYRRVLEEHVVEEIVAPPPMRWVPEKFWPKLPIGPRGFVKAALAAGWKVGVTDVGNTNLVVRVQRPATPGRGATRLAACWVYKGGGKGGPRWQSEGVLCVGAAPAPILSVTEAKKLLSS